MSQYSILDDDEINFYSSVESNPFPSKFLSLTQFNKNSNQNSCGDVENEEILQRFLDSDETAISYLQYPKMSETEMLINVASTSANKIENERNQQYSISSNNTESTNTQQLTEESLTEDFDENIDRPDLILMDTLIDASENTSDSGNHNHLKEHNHQQQISTQESIEHNIWFEFLNDEATSISNTSVAKLPVTVTSKNNVDIALQSSSNEMLNLFKLWQMEDLFEVF